MARVAEGYIGWGNFSRFTSNGLTALLHLDGYITDISPLTQCIAAFILSVSGVILLYVVYERKSYSVWELIALIPMGLNPYFLECFSYKFDSPFMALSVLAAVAPLLFRKSTPWKYILSIAIGTVLMCTTYQAASGIFPMVVVLLSLRMWLKKDAPKDVFRFILNSVIGYGIGLLFFKSVIMLNVPTDNYVSNALPAMTELLPAIIANYKKYFGLILSDYETLWKWILLMLMLAFAFSGLKTAMRRKAPAFALTILAGCIMLLLCFGLYPALANPLFEPRAMYGFGVFITLLCICTAEQLHGTLLKIPAVMLAFVFFVFSFTYGNALFVQKTYTDFRITQVVSDLNDMDEFLSDEPVTVQIAGTIGYSPVVEQMVADCNVLGRLVPVTFQEYWWPWGTKSFYGYYGLNAKEDRSVDLKTLNLALVKDGMYHSIYSDAHSVLVELK